MTSIARRTAVPIGGLVAFFAILLAAAPFLRVVDNAARDAMLTTLSPWTKAPDEIVLVTIHESTLTKFTYRSPIDRKFLGDTVAAIFAKGPKAVGIDILFDQPTEPDKDRHLKQVLQNAKIPVYVAYADARNGLTDGQSKALARFTTGLKLATIDLAKDENDGVVRRMIGGHTRSGKWIGGIAAELAAAAGTSPDGGRMPDQALTYYRTAEGTPYKFKQYRAETVPLLPAAWIRDKLVLIGTDLPLTDRHRTPFQLLNGTAAGVIPGVLIHAHGLAQILAGDRVGEIGRSLYVLLICGLCALAILSAYSGLHPLLRFSLLALICIGFWIAVAVLFRQTGTLVSPAWPTLLVLLAGSAAFAHVWYRDRKQRLFIEDAFSHYVSPAYVERLIAHPEELNLGGKRREVSSVFTDVAGFTTLSEQLEPAQLSALLNSYLDGLCGLFLEHGATIDKIIGDAVVGFLGAPLDQEDHAARAVSLVLAIDAYSENFRRQEEAKGLAFGETRVGAHTGPAVIGNFGGSQFFDYTGLGDTINTAARLEAANKYFGTRVCVSGTTAKASNWQHFRPIGSIVLKGKTDAVEVLEPVPEARARSGSVQDYCAAYALLAAKDRKAVRAFERLAVDWPDDHLISFHLNRLHNGDKGTVVTLSGK